MAVESKSHAHRTSWRRAVGFSVWVLLIIAGLGGPFAGCHGEALIVAGGANFTSAASSGDLRWTSGFALSRPLAYGACASTSAGVVCVGGNDADRVFADAFVLSWRPETAALAQTPLPPSAPGPEHRGRCGSHRWPRLSRLRPGWARSGDRDRPCVAARSCSGLPLTLPPMAATCPPWPAIRTMPAGILDFSGGHGPITRSPTPGQTRERPPPAR